MKLFFKKLLFVAAIITSTANFVEAKTIAIIFAMEEEAQPTIEAFGLQEDSTCLDNIKKTFPDLTMKIYKNQPINGSQIILSVNGKDHRFDNVDRVGTIHATINTGIIIAKFHPDVVISAGTAGGRGEKGAEIGKVYLINKTMFHDRRIPAGPDYVAYGTNKTKHETENIAQELGLPVATLSTGDSLDKANEDIKIIEDNGATVKDMEGAAVAEVCKLTENVSFIGLKAITDIFDSNEPVGEQFWANLCHAREQLTSKLCDLVDYLSKN
ncbi:hypothetical protein KAU11_01295 [Candidatus Babeliales bacterium]|nr:hypothetical protein [Candidatus Babeliales bacterium]